MHKTLRFSRRFCVHPILALALFAPGLLCASSTAYAATSATECKSLTYQESSDKNYFQITVKASAPSGTTITGYHFDYGDKTTYDFGFPSNTTADRTTATVRHTYQDNGAFAVSATVLTKANGKTDHITSDNCKTTIVNGQTTSTPLTNTGPGNLILLFTTTTIISTLAFYQRKIHQTNRQTQ